MLRIALKGAPKRHLPPERYVQVCQNIIFKYLKIHYLKQIEDQSFFLT
jgi:hypothetical protein